MKIDAFLLGEIRCITQSDLKKMLEWRNEPAVRDNMYTHHVISLAEHLSWWEKASKMEHCKYFIYQSKGVPMGVIYFTNINQEHGNASWGFYTSPEAPKGTGSKMEFLALEYAFNDLKIHKLNCEVLSFNSAVIKMHQKFGFIVEGEVREQHLKDNALHNICLLGITRTEWQSCHDAIYSRLIKLNSR